MGFQCPVCGSIEADGEHLANHLAITGLLHGDDHADWLDDRVEDWADRGPDELEPEIRPHVETVDHEQIGSGEAGHEHAGRERAAPGEVERAIGRQATAGRSAIDADVEEVLREARELTERRRAGRREDADARDADAGRDDAGAERRRAETPDDVEAQDE